MMLMLSSSLQASDFIYVLNIRFNNSTNAKFDNLSKFGFDFMI